MWKYNPALLGAVINHNIWEISEKHQYILHYRFDQSFEVVKQVFSQFNLYVKVLIFLNETTLFQTAAMTQEDFDNISFGKVCEQWKPTVLFCVIFIRLLRIFNSYSSYLNKGEILDRPLKKLFLDHWFSHSQSIPNFNCCFAGYRRHCGKERRYREMPGGWIRVRYRT